MTIDTDEKILTKAQMAAISGLTQPVITARLLALHARGENVTPVPVENMQLFAYNDGKWAELHTRLVSTHYTQDTFRLVTEYVSTSRAGCTGKPLQVTNTETGDTVTCSTQREAAERVGCSIGTLMKYVKLGEAYNGFLIEQK